MLGNETDTFDDYLDQVIGGGSIVVYTRKQPVLAAGLAASGCGGRAASVHNGSVSPTRGGRRRGLMGAPKVTSGTGQGLISALLLVRERGWSHTRWIPELFNGL